MLAWILKTKPVNFGSSGLHHALERGPRQRARRVLRRTPLSSSSTPKLLTAEPKNTGVCRAGAVALAGRSAAARAAHELDLLQRKRRSRSPRNSRASVARESLDGLVVSPTRPFSTGT